MRKFFGLLALLLAAQLPVNAFADMVPVGTQSIAETLGTNTTLIAPSSNTKGVYLRTCTLIAQGAASSAAIAQLVTTTSTPTGSDFTILVASANTGTQVQASLPYPLFIPATVGLYGLSSGSAVAFCTYDLQN